MPARKVKDLLEEVQQEIPVTKHVVSHVAFPQGFSYTQEDVGRWKQFIESGRVVERLSALVAPSVVGMRAHKVALLLSLVSLGDWGDCKNRLHTMYYGPTGTAKTQLAATVLRLGGGWSSVRSSQVGLTASGSGKDVEYGLLPLHNGGAVAVDELDKLPRADQAGCLSAMEEGIVPINVGKHHEVLEAEVIVVATVNEPEKLTSELLDRFDFVLHTPEPSIRDARDIIQARIRAWGLQRVAGSRELGKYLTWVRGFEPSLPEDVREHAIVAAQHLATRVHVGGRVRIRRLETLVRTALAHARLYCRDVTVEDVEQAAVWAEALNQRP